VAESKYEPVSHDHEAFLKNARKREGFRKAYEDLKEEYSLIREMRAARSKSGLTQEAVAVAARWQSRRQNRAAGRQAQQQQEAAFSKARAACPEGRGYTVK
jgi:hypothetical protein